MDADDKNAIPDAAKAARLLTDIAAVSQEMDLSGLSVVEADSGLLASASQKVPPFFPDPVVGILDCFEGWLQTAVVDGHVLVAVRGFDRKAMLGNAVQVQNRAETAFRDTGMTELSQADVDRSSHISDTYKRSCRCRAGQRQH